MDRMQVGRCYDVGCWSCCIMLAWMTATVEVIPANPVQWARGFQKGDCPVTDIVGDFTFYARQQELL